MERSFETHFLFKFQRNGTIFVALSGLVRKFIEKFGFQNKLNLLK